MSRCGRASVITRSALVLALATASVANAQAADASTDPVYRVPSPELSAFVDAPPAPTVSLSPDRTRLALMERPSHPGIAELAEPELRLAGYRIRPRVLGPSRRRPMAGLSIVDVATGEARRVEGLPGAPRLDNLVWSPDGRNLAFTREAENGIELWVADVEKARARRLTKPILNLSADLGPRWLDDHTLLCPIRRERAGAAPEESPVPTGPIVQENLGEKSPAVTYQDLLRDAGDEALFEHYFASSIARVDLGGKVKRLTDPGIVTRFDPSPDARFVLVETVHRPFSYLVTAEQFPRRVEIVDRDGRRVRLVADLPLQESIPIKRGSVATGPREFEWRSDAPATLMWAEALDGGDAGIEAAERDRLFLLAAPFEGEATPWLTLPLRYSSVGWGRGDFALVSEWWWETRKTRTYIAKPGDPSAAPEVLWDRSFQDRYGDPGTPAMIRDEGRLLLQFAADGRSLFLLGDGASPEGNRPFLDVLDPRSRGAQRRFRSEAPWFERPIAVLDDEGRRVLTSRESVEEPTNYFVRDLDDGSLRALTSFPHPLPALRGMKKEMLRYERADGVQLTATLYLPPGWEPAKGPLPMVVWAYPQEFKSADHAGQVTDSPHRFDRPSWTSPTAFISKGYAVLDDPSMPIVGQGEAEPNDTFRHQLVASAEAMVEAVVKRGVAERGKIAIGGHSYGAFMAANLLAHTDLFAAGIARTGAYNRTLTPFGFQSEDRTLWEAPSVYFDMSPFMHAEKVNEPILLVHGDADNNPGTFPMQSERFYNAIKGHGGRARLVMLPYESHGYRARESVLHVLWEEERWLERWVRDASGKRAEADGESSSGAAGAASREESPCHSR